MSRLTLRCPHLPCRAHTLLVAAGAALIMSLACSRNLDSPPARADGPTAAAQTRATSGLPRSAAGVRWSAPASWDIQPDRPMRVVTYRIPAAGTSSEEGECSVFFFGAGQGGDVESNILRWQGQFEPEGGNQAATAPLRESRVVRGINVTVVDIFGTYLLSPAPMSPQKIPKPDYRMLGAIAAAPGGNVFFKLTGPAAIVAAAKEGFEALLDSLERT